MDENFMLNFRKQIDNIDNEILILLKRRFQIAKKIAKYKMDNNMEIYDPNREAEILKILSNKSITMDLSESFIRTIFQAILVESKIQQKNFLDNIKG